jgi:probable F420-dependent oxidoreductase
MFANTGRAASAHGALDLARGAEAAGVESLWTVEHVVVPSGYQSAYPYARSGRMAGGVDDFDIPDPLVWLAYVAAVTSTVKLATGILIVPQRNPLITAKEVATLDQLSGGRMVLGVGVGWLAEEFQALGVPFERRGARLDAYVEAMRALWDQDQASVSNEFVDFRSCISRPQPVQGRVPIVIGGHTDAAARRAGRIGDGFFPGGGSIEDLSHLFGVMRAAAEDAGRDPAQIELTAGGGGRTLEEQLARIDALHELGVHRIVVPPLPVDALAGTVAAVEARTS